MQRTHGQKLTAFPGFSLRSSVLTCFEFCKSQPYLCTGTDTGSVVVMSVADGCLIPRLSLAARNPARGRCRSVSWNPVTERIAAGYDREVQPPGQRDNGAVVVWDVSTAGVNYTAKAAQSHAATTGAKDETLCIPAMVHMPLIGGPHVQCSAVRWLQESLLGVGAVKNVSMWDVRAHPETATRVRAHDMAVLGIELDPRRPHIVATYSDGPGEPIKMWDIRKIDQSSPIPWAVVRPQEFSKSTYSPATVTNITFSNERPGVLASLCSDSSTVSFWDVSGTESIIDVPIQTFMATAPLRCISLGGATGGSDPDAMRGLLLCVPQPAPTAGASNEHLLVANVKGGGEPLAISSRGCVASASRREVYLCSAPPGDVAGMMRVRSAAGYGMDVGRNLEVLCREASTTEQALSDASESATNATRLLALWTWVKRVEQLGLSVSTASVEKLLAHDNETDQPTAECEDPGLNCPVFVSQGRSSVLRAAGWGCIAEPVGGMDSESLHRAMKECEQAGNFQRSAALAVWHGHLGDALGVLAARASETYGDDEAIGTATAASQYLQMISLCIAGFGPAPSSLWQSVCASLTKSLQIHGESHPYLQAVCAFLLGVSLENDGGAEQPEAPPSGHDLTKVQHLRFKAVLLDERLSLEDRAAFASRFLPPAQLGPFIQYLYSQKLSEGSLEGILLRGLDSSLPLLQRFVDNTGDVQTLALLVCRAPPLKSPLEKEWIECYRDMLDSWEAWETRALLDVGSSQLRRSAEPERAVAAAEDPTLFAR